MSQPPLIWPPSYLPSGGVYSHLPLGNLRGYFPFIFRYTLWCYPPASFRRSGSPPTSTREKRRTACTISFNNLPNVCVLDPSSPSIPYICYHLFLAFLMLETNSSQSLSVYVRLRPRYLNAAMFVSGSPYTHSSASAPAWASSAASLWFFRSATLAHCFVFRWCPFRISHGTSM